MSAAAPAVATGVGLQRLGAGGAAPRVGESSTLRLTGLPPGAVVSIGPLRLEAGASGELAVRLPGSDLAGHVGVVALSVDGVPAGEIEVTPEKLTRDAYWRLRADLEDVWSRLAFEPAAAFSARARGPRAAELWRRIAASVEGIRRAPRARLERATAYGRLDRVRSAASLRPGLLRAAARGGTGPVDQVVASLDTPDNRLVRETLERLARAARRQEDGGPVAEAVGRVLRGEPWTRVGAHAGRAAPTHGVLRDARYRVVFEALRALEDPISAAVEGPGDLRLGLKALSRLYEYWVYLQVLRAAEARFGAPLGEGYRALARRFGARRARLDLPPGTTVEFPGRVRVAFEPAIWAAATRSWEGLELVPHPEPALAATLATPDVVVAMGGDPLALLVIDAKYVARGFVELEAAKVHARYARIRHRGRGVVARTLVAHPHGGVSADWAGYGHRPFLPGTTPPEIPWPSVPA